jgi:hypothetical protein
MTQDPVRCDAISRRAISSGAMIRGQGSRPLGTAGRRGILAAAAILPLALAAPARAAQSQNLDVTGWSLPPLRFTMTDAGNGR